MPNKLTLEDVWNLFFKQAVKRRLPMSPVTSQRFMVAYAVMAADRRFGVVDATIRADLTTPGLYLFQTGFYIEHGCKVDKEDLNKFVGNWVKTHGPFSLADDVKIIMEQAIEPALNHYLSLIDRLTVLVEKKLYKTEYVYHVEREIVKTERHVIRVLARSEEEADRLFEFGRGKMNNSKSKKGITEWRRGKDQEIVAD